jgi:trehalose 6-phosphate synthase
LVIVSNRVALTERGKETSGGLVTGVLDALRETGGVWFGWSGETGGQRSAEPRVTEAGGLTYATVDLTHEDRDGYYNGFCNSALWPLFHYRLDLVKFTRRDFAAYQRVNTLFANNLAPMLLPDDLVWVHDYHLIPMAENRRRAGAEQRLGFFLHTPFPSFGVLAVLPHYKSLLESLCAYDLVGFQTTDDLTAFHDAIVRGASGEDLSDGRVRAFGRTLRAGVFPIGIDTEAIAEMAGPAIKSRTLRRFQQGLRDRRLIIGVDRLDYSKGLEHRFRAFASFLERFPENRGQVRFLQIATATRSNVPEYRALRQRLGALAGDIDGRFSDLDWTPIQYLNRSFAQRTLFGFFRLQRLLLIEQGARELLDLASLLRGRFGGEPAQRLGDEPLALRLHEGRTLGLQTHDHTLVRRPHLIGSLDLLGPQLRELRVAHPRRLRDQLVDLLGVAAVPGPQRFDLSDTALVLGEDSVAALVRDVEQRALELARDPLQVLRPVLHATPGGS